MMELKHIEGNEHELHDKGTHIATIYTNKDTYVWELEKMVKHFNEKEIKGECK